MTELQNDPAMLKLIDYAKGKERVSYEEVHDFLPDSVVNSDKIDDVIAILAKHNVALEDAADEDEDEEEQESEDAASAQEHSSEKRKRRTDQRSRES